MYLCLLQITNTTDRLKYDPSWNTYIARYNNEPKLEENYGFCPGASNALDCSYEKNPLTCDDFKECLD